MKQWCLPNFVLDLADLWTHPKGPRLIGNEGLLSQAIWKSVRRRIESGSAGFFDLPIHEKTRLTTMEQVAKELRQNFEGAVLLGIGGSHWGAEAILNALAPYEYGPFSLTWITQPDSDRIETVRTLSKQKRLASVIISKSGNTTETLSAFYHLSQTLDPRGFVIITDPKSGELRELATKEGWTSFEIPPNVGGRFSVLTSAGLFPALLGGISASDLLSGAARVRDALMSTSAEECPAFWTALSYYRWDTECHRPIQYFMPYRESFSAFSHWFVQLWAESLGKKTAANARVGFTPVAALGPSDQHSLLQLFKDGPSDKIIGLLDVRPRSHTPIGMPSFQPGRHAYLTQSTFEQLIHSSCVATQTTLRNSNVPTYRILIEHIRAETLGSLFFFFETACALAGELYDVDAYGQPAVEEGKRLLKESLLAGTAH